MTNIIINLIICGATLASIAFVLIIHNSVWGKKNKITAIVWILLNLSVLIPLSYFMYNTIQWNWFSTSAFGIIKAIVTVTLIIIDAVSVEFFIILLLKKKRRINDEYNYYIPEIDIDGSEKNLK